MPPQTEQTPPSSLDDAARLADEVASCLESAVGPRQIGPMMDKGVWALFENLDAKYTGVNDQYWRLLADVFKAHLPAKGTNYETLDEHYAWSVQMQQFWALALRSRQMLLMWGKLSPKRSVAIQPNNLLHLRAPEANDFREEAIWKRIVTIGNETAKRFTTEKIADVPEWSWDDYRRHMLRGARDRGGFLMHHVGNRRHVTGFVTWKNEKKPPPAWNNPRRRFIGDRSLTTRQIWDHQITPERVAFGADDRTVSPTVLYAENVTQVVFTLMKASVTLGAPLLPADPEPQPPKRWI